MDKRFLVLICVGLALMIGCGDDGNDITPDVCAPSDPPPVAPNGVPVVFETYNAALGGALLPALPLRQDAVIKALKTSTADVICLQEVWTDSDKQAIINAVTDPALAKPFVDSYWTSTTLDTVVNDPTTASGATVPEPTTPPCSTAAESNDVSLLEAALTCIVDNCSTIVDGKPYLTGIDCVLSKCQAAAAGLIFANPICYTCAATQLPSEPLDAVKERCTMNPRQRLAFQGTNGVMLLSRHTLSNKKTTILPATFNQRVALAATVNGSVGGAPFKEFVAVCNHLSPIFTNPAFPYTGGYGNGMTGASGWAAEQLLQTDKIEAFLDRSGYSASAPVVYLGDLNSSQADECSADFLKDEGPATLAHLIKDLGYTQARAFAFEPVCTFCSVNPFAATSANVWIDHILLKNFVANSTTVTKRVYDTQKITVPNSAPPPPSRDLPISDHFGLQATVILPAR